MGWSVVALVIAMPIDLVILFLGGLNASTDGTAPPALLAADLVGALAALAAVITLIVAPLLGRVLQPSGRAAGIRRVFHRVAILAVLSPVPVLVLTLVSR